MTNPWLEKTVYPNRPASWFTGPDLKIFFTSTHGLIHKRIMVLWPWSIRFCGVGTVISFSHDLCFKLTGFASIFWRYARYNALKFEMQTNLHHIIFTKCIFLKYLRVYILTAQYEKGQPMQSHAPAPVEPHPLWVQIHEVTLLVIRCRMPRQTPQHRWQWEWHWLRGWTPNLKQDLKSRGHFVDF